jgi:hypothetical protein
LLYWQGHQSNIGPNHPKRNSLGRYPMHPILHCLLIAVLLGGLLQPARPEPTANQAPEPTETQEEALSLYQLKLAVELDNLQAKTGLARLRWAGRACSSAGQPKEG